MYGKSHRSVPENFLQQIIEQLDCKQLKDNKVVETVNKFLDKSHQTDLTGCSDRLTVPAGREKSASLHILILNTAFGDFHMTSSQVS